MQLSNDQDLRPRAKTLSFMASLSVASGEIRAAEGYLLELLAWSAFGGEPTNRVDEDDFYNGIDDDPYEY